MSDRSGAQRVRAFKRLGEEKIGGVGAEPEPVTGVESKGVSGGAGHGRKS